MNLTAGMKSSECILLVLVALLAVFGKQFGVEITGETINGLLAGTGLYAVGRGMAKGAAPAAK